MSKFKVGDIRVHITNPKNQYIIVSVNGYRCSYRSNVTDDSVHDTSVDAMERYTRKLTKLDKALQ